MAKDKTSLEIQVEELLKYFDQDGRLLSDQRWAVQDVIYLAGRLGK